MEPFRDIHRKEDLPDLTRRRPPGAHPPADANVSPPPGIPPPSAAGGAGSHGSPAQVWPPPPRHSSRGHRRRRSGDKGGSGSRVLWVALTGVFLVYALFLVTSIVRKPKKAAALAAVDAASGAAALMEDAGAGAALTAQEVVARVAAWTKAQEALRTAQSYQDKGFPDQAIEGLRRALEDAPHVLVLQEKLAQLLMQQQRLDEARGLFVEVLEKNPENSNARLALAGIFESQTNYPAAQVLASWILDREPNSIEALQIAANVYLSTEQSALAINPLKRLINLDRENIIAQNRLSVVYMEMREFQKAIDLLNDALHKSPKDSVTYYNLAVCHAKQGKAAEAVDVLARAISVFGREFIRTWMQSRDFDLVRSEPLFVRLMQQEKRAEPLETEPEETGEPSGPEEERPLRPSAGPPGGGLILTPQEKPASPGAAGAQPPG